MDSLNNIAVDWSYSGVLHGNYNINCEKSTSMDFPVPLFYDLVIKEHLASNLLKKHQTEPWTLMELQKISQKT
uniref:SFRICE_033287 n=1 Tax=Spodoptera frugiperda TaxID=7108 RepID=A0A2H1WM31_SPOFR